MRIKLHPVQIGTETDWDLVDAGSWHTVALKLDGTLWAWGSNWLGQLGDSSTVDRNSPVKIGTDTNWKSIAAGWGHTLALKSDGTLWAWGNNATGELGDGTDNNIKTYPVRIGSDNDWTSISTGQDHALALKSDGTLWAWGNNDYGQLGDGTTIHKNYPVKISTETDWISIAARGNHSIALRSNGTLWAWGNNFNGQLGDGTKGYQETPLMVFYLSSLHPNEPSNGANIHGLLLL